MLEVHLARISTPRTSKKTRCPTRRSLIHSYRVQVGHLATCKNSRRALRLTVPMCMRPTARSSQSFGPKNTRTGLTTTRMAWFRPQTKALITIGRKQPRLCMSVGCTILTANQRSDSSTIHPRRWKSHLWRRRVVSCLATPNFLARRNLEAASPSKRSKTQMTNTKGPWTLHRGKVASPLPWRACSRLMMLRANRQNRQLIWAFRTWQINKVQRPSRGWKIWRPDSHRLLTL